MNYLLKERVIPNGTGREVPDNAYLLRFLFQSFRHAQGSLEVQLETFRKVALMHPDWSIADEQKAFLMESFSGRMNKFFSSENPPQHQTVKSYSATGEEVITGLQKRLNEARNPASFDISIYTGHVIARDYAFLIEKKRRPRGSNKINEKNPILDPYLSYICYYGIEGHTTGLAEFDELYTEVRGLILNAEWLASHSGNDNKWRKVVQKYVLMHPSKRAAYEDLDLVKPKSRVGDVVDRMKRAYLQFI